MLAPLPCTAPTPAHRDRSQQNRTGLYHWLGLTKTCLKTSPCSQKRRLRLDIGPLAAMRTGCSGSIARQAGGRGVMHGRDYHNVRKGVLNPLDHMSDAPFIHRAANRSAPSMLPQTRSPLPEITSFFSWCYVTVHSRAKQGLTDIIQICADTRAQTRSPRVHGVDSNRERNKWELASLQLPTCWPTDVSQADCIDAQPQPPVRHLII